MKNPDGFLLFWPKRGKNEQDFSLTEAINGREKTERDIFRIVVFG